MFGVVIAGVTRGSGGEELFVPADGSVAASAPLAAGEWYIIEARGTYYYKDRDSWPGKYADAEWVRTEIDEALVWVETPGGGDLDLYVDAADISMMGKVDGETFSRHVYSSEHIYRANVFGAGATIELSIYDENYGDNSGGLHVSIDPGWQDETVVLPMGDTNADGVVDASDHANLIAQFGGPPTGQSADFNGDEIVDLDDLAIQRANFGLGVASAPAGESGATTPEPAALAMIAFGGLAIIRPRRSKGGARK